MKKNKIIILYSGEYPGRTASCRRVELYKKGLVDSGAFVDVVSTYNLCGNKFFYIYYSIAVYFIIINKILSLDNDVNVVIVYGYGWLGIWLVGILLKFKNIKFKFWILDLFRI